MGELRARPRRSGQLDHDPEALEWAIKQAGVTQKWLSSQLDISPGHMSDIVSGRRNLTPANLTKAAKLLKCPRVVLARSYADGEVA